MAVNAKYEYSTDGVYTRKNINTTYTTTQQASGTAGFNWNDRTVATEVVAVNPDYQEGAGTVGGPSKNNYFEVINDDLVLKYNVHDAAI